MLIGSLWKSGDDNDNDEAEIDEDWQVYPIWQLCHYHLQYK